MNLNLFVIIFLKSFKININKLLYIYIIFLFIKDIFNFQNHENFNDQLL